MTPIVLARRHRAIRFAGFLPGFVLVFLGLVLARPSPAAPAHDARARVATALEQALGLVHVSRGDLALPTDYEKPDEWRLAVVDSAMHDPLSVGDTCWELADRATRDSTALPAVSPALRALVDALVFDARSGAPRGAPPRGNAGKAFAAGDLAGAAPAIQAITLPLLAGVERVRADLAAAFAELGAEECDSLARYGPKLIEEDVTDPSKTIFQLEREKREDLALSEGIFAIVAKVRMDAITVAALDAAREFDLALYHAARMSASDRARAVAETARQSFDLAGAAEGDVVYYRRLDDGITVIVGGPGRTIYHRRFDIMIDLGGDDEYLDGAAGATEVAAGAPFPVCFAVDLAGNDHYATSTPAGLAAGYLGVGMLADLAGNDTYQAGNFALGCGWYGAGALLDGAGDDRYVADTAAEGAASAGCGILSDRAGADSYEAAFASQGFGFTGGAALLDDRAGNDFYLIRPRYTDLIRYEDHFVSLSQGFGYGNRPDKSGGIGLLVEGGGNDLYLSDIFGQGAAYWYALGCLVDRAGNDAYVSHQYAQGAGIHLASAALIDSTGEDRYFARGVSQGCGHDLGVGLLRDGGGNDTYTAFDLSQGAGSANGIGILVDEWGEDGYWVKRADNTHGYGNPRREYGSTGLLVDLAGHDHYSGNGADTTAWIGPWFGVGLDVEPPAAPATRAAPAAPVVAAGSSSGRADTAFVPPVPPGGGAYTPEDLFILASSIEPRFERDRLWARQEILRRKSECIPVLIAHMDTRDAPERQAVTDILKSLGKPAIEPLTRSLASDNWRVVLLAARTLGEMNATRAAPALARAAKDPNWVVREAAVTALGKVHDRTSAPLVRRALGEDRSPQVRKSAAYALGQIGGDDAVAPLIAALGDERGMVRETARASLGSMDTLAIPALRDLIALEAAGDRARPPRAVALAIETLRDLGRGLSADRLRRLTTSTLWDDAEVRSATARMIAARRDDEGSAEIQMERGILDSLAHDRDERVRGLAVAIQARRAAAGGGGGGPE